MKRYYLFAIHTSTADGMQNCQGNYSCTVTGLLTMPTIEAVTKDFAEQCSKKDGVIYSPSRTYVTFFAEIDAIATPARPVPPEAEPAPPGRS